MPPTRYQTYQINNTQFETKIYEKYELLAFHPEFAKNRKFESWKEVFYESLLAQREGWCYKKRSYENLASRFPKKIINIFLNLLVNDLIYKDVEFVLNPRANQENQYILKLGYIVNAPHYMKRRNRSNHYMNYGGMTYCLRQQYPRNWKHSWIRRKAHFYYKYKAKVHVELKRGHRYYNSAKDHLFSKL